MTVKEKTHDQTTENQISSSEDPKQLQKMEQSPRGLLGVVFQRERGSEGGPAGEGDRGVQHGQQESGRPWMDRSGALLLRRFHQGSRCQCCKTWTDRISHPASVKPSLLLFLGPRKFIQKKYQKFMGLNSRKLLLVLHFLTSPCTSLNEIVESRPWVLTSQRVGFESQLCPTCKMWIIMFSLK